MSLRLFSRRGLTPTTTPPYQDQRQKTKSDPILAHTYDDEGNRLTRTNISTSAVTEYTWDHRNRLTKVTEKNSGGTTTKVVEYEYDVFNRRISRSADSSSPFTMTDAAIERYVYDDVTGVASADRGNVVLDFADPDGSGSSPQVVAKRYLHGPAVDQILAQENIAEGINDADRVYWPLVDHLVTVRDLAQQDGTIAQHYKYDSYGQVTVGSTTFTRYLFTSRELDPSTGLQYSRARWYDNVTGRWLSEDPIGLAAGDANLSRYVRHNTLALNDPSGLRESPIYSAPGIPAPLSAINDPDVFAFMSRIIRREYTYGDLGYSNFLVGFIGEWVIRPMIGDDRLVQPGGMADDLLLTGLVATEFVGNIDPTGVSDGLNAGLLFLDGRGLEGGMVLAGAFVPGQLEDLAGRALRALPTNRIGGAVAPLVGMADEAIARAPRIPDPNWRQSTPSSRIFRENLGLSPGDGLDAHHIVPGRHPQAEHAREILNEYQIDINSADNGVALVGGPGAPQSVLPRHHHGSGLHGHRGIDAVTDSLNNARDGISDWETARRAILAQLQELREGILNGAFPPLPGSPS